MKRGPGAATEGGHVGGEALQWPISNPTSVQPALLDAAGHELD
jgi:hypothetical protein